MEVAGGWEEGQDKGPEVGPRRPPLRGGVGSSQGRAWRAAQRSQPKLLGEHRGHFTGEKCESRMGLAPGLPASSATSAWRHMLKSSLAQLGWAFGAGGPGTLSRAAQPYMGPAACGVSVDMLTPI